MSISNIWHVYDENREMPHVQGPMCMLTFVWMYH
jgi:hypothetical protein